MILSVSHKLDLFAQPVRHQRLLLHLSLHPIDAVLDVLLLVEDFLQLVLEELPLLSKLALLLHLALVPSLVLLYFDDKLTALPLQCKASLDLLGFERLELADR